MSQESGRSDGCIPSPGRVDMADESRVGKGNSFRARASYEKLPARSRRSCVEGNLPNNGNKIEGKLSGIDIAPQRVESEAEINACIA